MAIFYVKEKNARLGRDEGCDRCRWERFVAAHLTANPQPPRSFRSRRLEGAEKSLLRELFIGENMPREEP